MAVSRRKFLKAGGIVILAAGIPLKVVAGKSPDPHGTKVSPKSSFGRTDLLTHATLSAQLNTVFRVVQGGPEVVKLELREVNDLRTATVKTSAVMAGRECFSTIFVGPSRTPLQQNTYAVEHQALGNFSLLLVPVGPNRRGPMLYEAVFNRLF
jgi:hypothetical protein